jgi:Rrf2 family nitric oxide-sensitive transcriptional repressor
MTMGETRAVERAEALGQRADQSDQLAGGEGPPPLQQSAQRAGADILTEQQPLPLGLADLEQPGQVRMVDALGQGEVAAELCRRGYLEPVRGRNGGFRLAKDPGEIRIGEVIRQTEGETALVECFDPATNTCPLLAACRLRVALQEALAAFFDVLDRYTLADLIQAPEQLAPLLGLNPAMSPTGGDAYQ